MRRVVLIALLLMAGGCVGYRLSDDVPQRFAILLQGAFVDVDETVTVRVVPTVDRTHWPRPVAVPPDFLEMDRRSPPPGSGVDWSDWIRQAGPPMYAAGYANEVLDALAGVGLSARLVDRLPGEGLHLDVVFTESPAKRSLVRFPHVVTLLTLFVIPSYTSDSYTVSVFAYREGDLVWHDTNTTSIQVWYGWIMLGSMEMSVSDSEVHRRLLLAALDRLGQERVLAAP